MKWQTLCVVVWSAMLMACSEDALGPSRNLGAHVTYRIAGGLAPRETTLEIGRTGRVDLQIEDFPDENVLSARSVLTSEEFDELARLLEAFYGFESCYCTNEGLVDGPSWLIRVMAESTTDVHIYGVPWDDLPGELAEMVSLLSSVTARVRDQGATGLD